MRRPTPTDRFRYWFDEIMARGTIAQIGLLALASFVLIVVVAGVIVGFQLYPPLPPGESSQPSFLEVLWDSLVRTLSGGSIRGDDGWGYRGAMLVATIGGLIVVAALIGVVTTALENRVRRLRAGRSRVLENDHTVILGWSGKVVTIVGELRESAGNHKSAVVILTPRDKAEVEEELRTAIPDPGRTKLIVRSGQPMNRGDLAMVNPDSARSIIVLGPDGAEDPDAEVIKTVLALTNSEDRRPDAYSIVAELSRAGTFKVAQLISPRDVRWVLGSDLIGRITAQTCLQLGLSAVYTTLLDFEGDEFYLAPQPDLVDSTYAAATRSFMSSTVVGIARPDGMLLNAPADTVLGHDNQLVFIAADEHSIVREATPSPRLDQIVQRASAAAPVQRTLILGAHAGVPSILDSLASSHAPGSTVTIIADSEVTLAPRFESFVTVEYGDTSDRDVLEGIALAEFSNVVVLPYKERLSKHAADARTLVTLLQLRDLRKHHEHPVPIVSEMLDDRNRELASVAEAEDFVVSAKLVSLMLAQVSHTPRLTEVFAALFATDGVELAIRPATDYVVADAPVSFATVVESAAVRGETAIGFRGLSESHQHAAGFGVVINPRKDTERVYRPGDSIIVLVAS